MPVLVAYGTVEGQTGKIARFIEKIVQEHGDTATLTDTADPRENVDPAQFSQIVVAASVHERRHPGAFEAFVTANQAILNEKPTLLLSVSLSAAFDEGLEDAQDYADEMKMRTGLLPAGEMLVAGAVRSQSYGYYETQVLRYVVLRDRDYDFSAKEHDFTDWKALRSGVSAFLEGRAVA